MLAVICHGAVALAAGKASHVVLVVWDGMRPDFVSEATTPTLFARAFGTPGVTAPRLGLAIEQAMHLL